MKDTSLTVADFFAGIGLVTMGLNHAGLKTVYALDYDDTKALQYRENFSDHKYVVKDIALEKGDNVPSVDIAHASFPCTDLSLAGSRKGLYEGESSAFWHFARIIGEMQHEYGSKTPKVILLENVEGLLTSNGGNDLRELMQELNKLGYAVDLLRINAAHFVPQSRVRIFIIGVNKTLTGLDSRRSDLRSLRPTNARPSKIKDFVDRNADLDWYHQVLPMLPTRKYDIDSIIDPTAEWWPQQKADFIYSQLHSHHRLVVDDAMRSKNYTYFPAFRRMRKRDGKNQSTIEIRTDKIAGCLRTPKGGSARQLVIRAGAGKFEVRLFNAREAARLMGADDFNIHPSLSLNQSLFGFGDAVCVPVLSWIGENYLKPLVNGETLQFADEDLYQSSFDGFKYNTAPALN